MRVSAPLLHPAFELLAYAVGWRLFRRGWRASAQPFTASSGGDTLWIAVGAILGAALGSKLVFVLQYPEFVRAAFPSPEAVLGGKSIVGGLLGGVAGVELAKKRVGLRESTGDLFTYPVLFGLAIGRVGCLLSGLGDETFGGPTGLPWAWDFGDGVPRHPAPLYEIAFLLALAAALRFLAPRLPEKGDTFRVFMVAILAYRVFADFRKPPFTPVASAAEAALPRAHLWGSLTAIQIAALLGLLYYSAVFLRRTGRRTPERVS